LQCTDAAALPACAGESCCTPLCDVTLPEPQCEALPGAICAPFFLDGEAPLGFEDVGICVSP
jgi:hypothetical protein